jgi:hypothetical protein
VAALLKLGVSKKVAAVLILISLTAASIVAVNYVTVQAAVDSANDGASLSPSPSPSPSPSHNPEPCATTTMVAFAVSAAVVVAGLILYFRKREH